MNAQLDEIFGSTAEVAALQLSPRLFVIRTGITPITPLGFVHVYKTELGKIDCGLRYIRPNTEIFEIENILTPAELLKQKKRNIFNLKTSK